MRPSVHSCDGAPVSGRTDSNTSDFHESSANMSTDFDKECRVVEMYIDSAKSYSQLSTGALALAAVFGPAQLPNLGGGLLLASACFLVAALAGGAYQSLAV